MTEELQKCISGRTEEGYLAGEPARGLGASRRPSGDVRFTGSLAGYGARTFGRCFASTLHHRKNIAVQSHTKVSTLNQDLTKRRPTSAARKCGRSTAPGVAGIAVDDRHEHQYGFRKTSRKENRSVGSMPKRKKKTGRGRWHVLCRSIRCQSRATSARIGSALASLGLSASLWVAATHKGRLC